MAKIIMKMDVVSTLKTFKVGEGLFIPFSQSDKTRETICVTKCVAQNDGRIPKEWKFQMRSIGNDTHIFRVE